MTAMHYLYFRYEVTDQERTAVSPAFATENREMPVLPWFQRKVQPACLFGGGLLVLNFVWWSWPMTMPLEPGDVGVLRLSGSVLLGMSFAYYFMVRYIASVRSQQGTRMLDAPWHLAWLGFWISILVTAALFTYVYAQRDFGPWIGHSIDVVTALLVIETWVRSGLALYQPRTLEKNALPLGGSLALETLFSHENIWEVLVRRADASFGVKLRDGQTFQFLRRTIEPALLVVILMAWLSTCFTSIPTEAHGVRVRWGRYLSPPLDPGLYVTWPWPAEKIEIIPTERVENISLGFERDLGGAALWTEKHFEGEQNLLVGNGEELLSITVPVYYRIKDPLAYMETTTDAREALISLAYRQLLAVTEGRDSFRVMTVERQEIGHTLKQSLQQEVDRMHLGLEIVYVALEDIHPPVAVAPAYQDVVSAEEEMLANVHLAQGYQYQTVAQARQQAHRLQTEADADAEQRVALADGESAHFLNLASADTELFRLRLQMEAMEAALGKPQKVVVTPAAATNQQIYLDLRGVGASQTP